MDNTHTRNRDLTALAWAFLIMWWGIRWLFAFLPNGTGLVGTGLILLSLNAVRWQRGIPGKFNTTLLGIFALVTGGLIVASAVIPLPFEPPVLAISLIVAGAVLLVGQYLRPHQTRFEARG